jgi:hypothetical protein
MYSRVWGLSRWHWVGVPLVCSDFKALETSRWDFKISTILGSITVKTSHGIRVLKK